MPDAGNAAPNVSTEVQRQFWRESEQRWVDHVLIRTWGEGADRPTRWRSRVVTVTTTTGGWQDGAQPTRPMTPAATTDRQMSEHQTVNGENDAATVDDWRAAALKFSDDYHAELSRRIDAEALLVRAAERVRHDHAYPEESGPHHCAGCDLEAEIRRTVQPGHGTAE